MLKIRKTKSRICSLSMVCLAQLINYFSSILLELPLGQMFSFRVKSEEKPLQNCLECIVVLDPIVGSSVSGIVPLFGFKNLSETYQTAI